ncbi:MAG: phage head closure protein [Rhizobiales bacterium]|nr:phage head closure protein [Hyphomicrobiales bacterium]
MTGAGDLNWRMRFESPQRGSDGAGGSYVGWQPEFTVWAELYNAGGSEAVMAARLEGRTLVRVRIRWSDQARRVGTDWRMIDARTGRIWNIREVDDVSEARHFVRLSCEAGVAT